MSGTTLRTLHQEQPQFILLFCNAHYFLTSQCPDVQMRSLIHVAIADFLNLGKMVD
ncbi:hypothetical protein H6H02_25840 [Coleofasciculus sp. FACHB-1120]|nr:hypothetical protein [Coleofasciculus sp. FACHB-1120]